MMAEPSVKDRVTTMVRDIIGPPLKEKGFRRSGRIFWRDSPDVCQVVNLEMNRWGTRQESSFSVHLGTFWHRVEEILENPSVGKMPPADHRCTFRIELGRTVPGRTTVSWAATLGTDYVSLGGLVLRDLLDYGLPWLAYRSDLSKTLEWERYRRPEGKGLWSTPEIVGRWPKVVFKVLLGKKADAARDLADFAKNGAGQRVELLRHRLGIT